MTGFSFLAPTWHFLLTGLLFFSAMSELFVCIYQYRWTDKLKDCFIDTCLFVLLLSMLFNSSLRRFNCSESSVFESKKAPSLPYSSGRRKHLVSFSRVHLIGGKI